ncbi:MAG: glycoside hydrolase family 95 protein [Chitinophagaceae bacterium]
MALIAAFIFIGMRHKEAPKNQENRLFYNEAATNWNEALPLGNGRMGAMVFGGIDTEHLQLNENTLYSGEPSQSYKKVNITGGFGTVMNLLSTDQNAAADEYIRQNWLGRLHANYEPLGDLFFTSASLKNIINYRRELDIAQAILRISYESDGVLYTREMFASHPDSVIVAKFSASKPLINISATFGSVHPTAKFSVANNVLSIKGQAPGYSSRRTLEQIETWKNQYKHPELFDANGKRKFNKQTLYGDEINGLGMYFEAQIKPKIRDGKLETDSNSIHIKNASEVVFILSEATSFNGFDKSPSREGLDPQKIAARILNKACLKSYEELKANHTRDYRKLFDRASLDLHSTLQTANIPTDQRIINFTKDNDPGLVELLFNYGRYLMISGSRKGGQPLNLQGIWNDQVIPPWNSGYTININTEMNYWPAEVTNLGECQEPLFRMIKEMAVTGKETATLMYKRRGWVAHHNVSIWRETFPNDGSPGASFWTMSPGWLLSHMWEHYLFTGDKKFLEKEAYPLMRGASMFYADWLIENREGKLVTAAGNSPENSFLNAKGEKAQISSGPTMDMTIVRELFTRTIEAAKMLGKDKQLITELSAKLARLAPFKIGAKGQIQEWQQDYAEPEPKHRHISHLYGLYPGNQIIAERPELMQAARKTLQLRGDEATGWSMGWKINMWARLQDGDHAYAIIRNLFKPTGFGEIKNAGGGLFKNLFDAHPPFQIDGNFGFTAGVAEMVLQSHDDYIQVLPALPAAWPSGEVKGLVTRGGFVIDLKWTDGKVETLSIFSKLGGKCRLKTASEMSGKDMLLSVAKEDSSNPLLRRSPDVPFEGNIQPGISLPASNIYEWQTEAGKTYHLAVKK